MNIPGLAAAHQVELTSYSVSCPVGTFKAGYNIVSLARIIAFSYPPPPSPNAVQDDIDDVIDELKNILEPYYEIGRRLHLSVDKLKQIRGQKLSAAAAMDEVIMEWLKKNYDVTRYGPPTWKALVDAVAHPAGGNNRAEAEGVASRHRASESSCMFSVSLL